MTSTRSWKSIMVAMFGAQGGTSVSLYTSIVYMLYFLQSVLKVEPTRASLCLAVGIAVSAPMYPVFGSLSDRIGRARVTFIGMLLWMACTYPVFAGIRAGALDASWATVSMLIAVLAVLTALIMAPLPAFIAECFPPQSRTTGFGLAQQLGNILFGGFLPLISLSLVSLTGNQLAGVAYSIVSLVPCLAVTFFWGFKRDRTSRRSVLVNAPASAGE
ncbi:MFS transporter [Paraburkholderia diazotrophica]|nr:MFS transporter [Paraburkholderia diazotrophica]